jgi:hypothetical protein
MSLTKNQLDDPYTSADNELLKSYLCGIPLGETPVLRRLVNSVLRWSLAGILAATSLLGNELHDLFGIHHAGELGLCDCHDLGTVGHQGEPSVAAGHSDGCDDGANCPICNYLAQARIVGERVQAIVLSASVPSFVLPARLSAPTPDLQPFQARAPPAA